MKRLLAVVATTAIALVTLIGLATHDAGADAPSQQGWWTTASTPVGVAPDVPPKGLLIEGGPSSPVAYAGLVYPLVPGAEASTLTLRVAPNSATTPNSTLELCPLDQPSVHAQQGGPMSDAPTYTCERHATAEHSDGGYRFDVAKLVSGGALAVAILPTDPTDRVVLSEPDGNSLAVRSVDSSTSPDSTSSVATASPLYRPGTAPSQSVPGLPNVAVSNGGEPALRAAPTTDRSPSSLTELAASPLSSSPARPLAVTVVVVALAVGLALWSRAGLLAVRRAAPSLSSPPAERSVQP